MRWLTTSAVALLVVIALFLLMQWMIAPPADPQVEARVVEGIEVVHVQEQEEPPPVPDNLEPPPPPPPAAPASLATALPTVSLPALAPPDASSSLKVPLSMAQSPTLGGSRAFGGFAGGGGQGQGAGFKGKELIPLSTARPQITEWAYKRGIEGWVEVVFTVMPSGRVQDIKIVDSHPRGVFEAVAIESISNWLYAEHPRARIVKQKVEFKLEDFQYNWR